MVVRIAESVPRAIASEAPIVGPLLELRSVPLAVLIPIILLILSFPASARAQQPGGNSSAATVGGRVMTEGKPAPGIVVVLSGHDSDAGWRQFAGETDAEGRFIIVGMQPGSYEIYPHAYVFVLANPSSNARIVLAYGDGVVRGRVRFQNGDPPKNLCFFVIADHKGKCDECRANIHSPVSAGGQYMLEGLPPGDYELTLHAHSCGIGVMPPIAPIKQMARVANGVETRADFVVDLNKKDQ